MALTDAAALPACEQQALVGLFGGDSALFLGFRAACIEQFPLDWAQAHQLLTQRQDWPALARLAHSLKGVLYTLGYAELGRLAQGLQESAQAAVGSGVPRGVHSGANCSGWGAAAVQWQVLQQQMALSFAIDLGPPVATPMSGACPAAQPK